ncbi:MAG: hypothetical protein ACK5ME_13205 [Parahaliea sp.]
MNLIVSLKERYGIQVEPLRSQRRLELLVVCLLLLLLTQLFVSAAQLMFVPDPEPVMPAPESLRLSALDARTSVNEGQSEALRERPLFFEGRKPEQAQEVAANQPEKEDKAKTSKPKLKLVGVFGVGAQQGIIALKSGKQSKQLRLYVGDELDGWTLQKVGENEAIMNNGKNDWSLTLQRSAIGISKPSASSTVENAARPDIKDAADDKGRSNTEAPARPESEKKQKEAPRGLVLGAL